jgi:hypothetical protein
MEDSRVVTGDLRDFRNDKKSKTSWRMSSGALSISLSSDAELICFSINTDVHCDQEGSPKIGKELILPMHGLMGARRPPANTCQRAMAGQSAARQPEGRP